MRQIYYPILTLGIIAAGGVYSGTNPSYTPFEIAHHFNTVHAKFIISEPELLRSILDAEHDVPKERVFVFDTTGQAIPDGYKGWKTLLEHGEMDWYVFPSLNLTHFTSLCSLWIAKVPPIEGSVISMEETYADNSYRPRFTDSSASATTNCMLMFSSGTTGLPKAVQITHYNMVAQHTMLSEDHPKPYEPRRLMALPMFHMASTPMVMIAPFRQGVTTYIMRRFDLEGFLKYHQEYDITELLVVPPMAVAIIMSPLNQKYSLKSVRHALCGAAPLDKGPQSRLKALLSPDAPFTQVWGMTETSCVATMTPWPEHDVTGGVGRMLNNLDAKLVDDAGRDITAPDTRGELCVRGPTITRGYFENEEANKRDFDTDGFFHTGDIAYMDAKSGQWYIVDRKKVRICPYYMIRFAPSQSC